VEVPGVGIKILLRSIDEPLRQIVANAGEDAALVLADEVPPDRPSRQWVLSLRTRCGSCWPRTLPH
jgi:hypothetical protein